MTTMTTAPQPDPPPLPQPSARHRLGPVGTAVNRQIHGLQHGYRNDRPAAVAALARLRRGAGRTAYAVQELLGLIDTDHLADLVQELPEDERRRFDLDRAEEAMHLAVTLWALHQQSQHDHDMHVPGHGLGSAVRDLMRAGSRTGTGPEAGRGDPASGGGSAGGTGKGAEEEIDEPLRKRFVRVSTATSLTIVAQRLREIVTLLRGAQIPLDYALLADQLYAWQRPAGRPGVHRAWGRDFHRAGTRRKKEAPRGVEANDGGPGGPDPAGTSDPTD